MPHVSKRKLKPEIATILGDQLLTFLSAARTKGEARVLADELLTKTERLMLGKRLAIIVMLARGYSFSQIEDVLIVSPQTITRVWKEFIQGEHQKLVRYAREYTKHFKKDSFWGALDRALTLGGALPLRAGRGRYKELRRSLNG